MSIRNGLGLVCRPIFANDDLGDVEFIVSLIFVYLCLIFSTIQFANKSIYLMNWPNVLSSNSNKIKCHR